MLTDSFRALVLAALFCTPLLAQAQVQLPRLPPQQLPPSERIVGLWSSTIEIGPCAGGPRSQLRGLNQFHAGGTLTETGSPPPATRGPGFGVWQFNRGTQRYDARMQFFRFRPDGSLDGSSDVHREIRLSADASSFEDQIVARLLDNDGNTVVELCGTATAVRVPVL